MSPDWNVLPEGLQRVIAQEAMYRAAEMIAGQAETLAGEMERGTLADRGGPEALRLLAAVLRLSARSPFGPGGTA
jgi:hypothetical protein